MLFRSRQQLNQVLCETTEHGLITTRLIHSRDSVYSLMTNNLVACFHSDGLQNIIAITDSLGSVSAKFAYNPFGVELIQTNNTPFQMLNILKFLGASGVFEEVPGLYVCRNRAYFARTGTFLSIDPIRPIGAKWKPSLYTYGDNNPINMADPSGEATWALLDQDAVGGLGHVAYLIEHENGSITYYSSRGYDKTEPVMFEEKYADSFEEFIASDEGQKYDVAAYVAGSENDGAVLRQMEVEASELKEGITYHLGFNNCVQDNAELERAKKTGENTKEDKYFETTSPIPHSGFRKSAKNSDLVVDLKAKKFLVGTKEGEKRAEMLNNYQAYKPEKVGGSGITTASIVEIEPLDVYTTTKGKETVSAKIWNSINKWLSKKKK